MRNVRNTKLNALYWQVLGRVVEKTGRWHSARELHAALLIATGRVDIVRLVDGRRVKVPTSISFEAMTAGQAQVYYDAALDVVCNQIMGGVTIEEVLDRRDLPMEAAA